MGIFMRLIDFVRNYIQNRQKTILLFGYDNPSVANSVWIFLFPIIEECIQIK